MFRRGGSTNEGIMSGLVDRRGYAEGDKVEQDWDWMEESGLGNLFKWGGNIAMDIPGTIFDHTIAPAANWGGEFFLGSSPGWSANKIQQAVRDKLWGDKADRYDPDNPDRFYFDEDADPDVFEILGYNFSAKPTGIFADDKESTVGAANANEPGDGPIIKQEIGGENKNLNVDGSSGEPVSAADDIKTVYEDLLPLLQSTMGVDDSEMNRQKYLELAKFGANLMAQPGGSLTRAIGKAAEQPLEGLSRIAETKRKAKKVPAEIAMKIALSETESGPVGKQIRDLKKIYPQRKGETANEWNKRIGDKVLERGTATREQTSEGRVKANTNLLIESEIFDSEFAAGKVGRAIANTGLDISYFEEWPKDKADLINGQHYFTKDGKLKLVKDKKVLTWNPKSSKFE